MRWSELSGQRLIGVQPLNVFYDDYHTYAFSNYEKWEKCKLCFVMLLADKSREDVLAARPILVVCDNKAGSYSYFSSWRLVELPKDYKVELTPEYKAVGSIIQTIYIPKGGVIETTIDDYDTIELGEIVQKNGKTGFSIDCGIKQIILDIDKTQIHYPDTIWDFI